MENRDTPLVPTSITIAGSAIIVMIFVIGAILGSAFGLTNLEVEAKLKLKSAFEQCVGEKQLDEQVVKGCKNYIETLESIKVPYCREVTPRIEIH